MVGHLYLCGVIRIRNLLLKTVRTSEHPDQ